MPEKLIYECSRRPFVVPEGLTGHKERVGQLEIVEYSLPDQSGPYGLRMEREVSTKEEAAVCHTEALELAHDLNIVWAYVAGMPLFPKRLVLQIAVAPEGWQTNFSQLEGALPSSAAMHAKINITAGEFSMRLPYMPLQVALSAVKAYRASDERSKTLIGLHFEAMRLLGSQAQLFLLAKALELAKAMLPGRDDKKRQAALPAQVAGALKQSLHWLYGVANRRLEIRHVVNKDKLLPRLNHTERSDFLHDADLVIRGVVQRELGIEAAIIKTQ